MILDLFTSLDVVKSGSWIPNSDYNDRCGFFLLFLFSPSPLFLNCQVDNCSQRCCPPITVYYRSSRSILLSNTLMLSFHISEFNLPVDQTLPIAVCSIKQSLLSDALPKALTFIIRVACHWAIHCLERAPLSGQ